MGVAKHARGEAGAAIIGPAFQVVDSTEDRRIRRRQAESIPVRERRADPTVAVALLRLFRRPCPDRQCVNVGLHQCLQCGINPPMPCQWCQPEKSHGYDVDIEVAATIAGTRMTGVALAVIDHLERDRCQGRLQGSTDGGDTLFAWQRRPGRSRACRHWRSVAAAAFR